MNNTVIGVAVLDRLPTRSLYLYLLCQYADGTKHLSTIPVRPEETAEPANAWTYRIEGEIIHVKPSLRISTTRPSKTNPEVMEPVELFHNTGEWSIPFKEFIPGEHIKPYDLFWFLNPKEGQ